MFFRIQLGLLGFCVAAIFCYNAYFYIYFYDGIRFIGFFVFLEAFTAIFALALSLRVASPALRVAWTFLRVSVLCRVQELLIKR